MSLSKQLIKMVIEDKDPEGAMEFLLGRYDVEKQAKAIHSMHCAVRRKMLKDDSNRRADYENEIRQLIASLDASNYDDRATLNYLLTKPLMEQQQIYKMKKYVLRDHQAQARLHKINPAIQLICDFKLPEHVVKNVMAYTRDARVKRMMHEDGRDYTMGRATMERIIADAKRTIDVIKNPIRKPKQWYDYVVCCGLLSGRRTWEIVSSLEWDPIPDRPFQARISGLAKSLEHEVMNQGHPEIDIPLLCDFDTFDKAMWELRGFRTLTGHCDDKENKIEYGLMNASQRVFGRVVNHTEKRNMYSEMAFRDRENSKFLTDCSRIAWIEAALGHKSSFHSNATYTAMNIE